MEKPELPELKKTSQSSCEFILNLYRTYSKEEIKQKEKFYIQKIKFLQTNNYPEKTIWKKKDRLNLLIYEEERRSYLEFLENYDFYPNDDNDLDQFDTEYWFNNEK